MRKSHVEQRSRRYAARQYVSESHDHKPTVTKKEKPQSTLRLYRRGTVEKRFIDLTKEDR